MININMDHPEPTAISVKNKKNTFALEITVLLIMAVFLIFFWPDRQSPAAPIDLANLSALYDKIEKNVLPKEGFATKIVLGETIVKLTEIGAIDIEKFKNLYQKNGGLSEQELNTLTNPSNIPININSKNTNFLLKILWPLGLTNKTAFNEQSPLNGEDLPNFASTGGWMLGKEDNGAAYFNKYEIIKLTSEQEALTLEIARNTYRPCCNNPTFFQDCNHGSALLGLLELGASQNLSKEELYRLTLQFNSFWFPSNYLETALYFKTVKNTDWQNVDAAAIMGLDFSSASGWSKNIHREMIKRKLLPEEKNNGQSCGV